MKRIVITLLAVIGIFGLAQVAGAVPVACPPPPPPAAVVDVVGGGPSVFSFSCGGLTFDQFNAIDAGGVPAGNPVNLVAATSDASTGFVVLTLNPFLSVDGVAQDIHLSFRVTGAINGIDLEVGGALSSVQEIACTGGITSAGTCSGILLANLVRSSGQPNVSAFFPDQSQVFIFKDIAKGDTGHLTSFNESFHVGVPEPTSLLLLGSALAGLGAWTRRKFRK